MLVDTAGQTNKLSIKLGLSFFYTNSRGEYILTEMFELGITSYPEIISYFAPSTNSSINSLNTKYSTLSILLLLFWVTSTPQGEGQQLFNHSILAMDPNPELLRLVYVVLPGLGIFIFMQMSGKSVHRCNICEMANIWFAFMCGWVGQIEVGYGMLFKWPTGPGF